MVEQALDSGVRDSANLVMVTLITTQSTNSAEGELVTISGK